MSAERTFPCGTRREDLHALHDGALEPARAAALREHAERCAHCGAELKFLRELAAAMRPAADEAVPEQAWFRIAAGLEAGVAPRAARGTLVWAGASLALASASAWLVLASWLGEEPGDPVLTVVGNGLAAGEVSASAALNFALGGALEEPSQVPPEESSQVRTQGPASTVRSKP